MQDSIKKNWPKRLFSLKVDESHVTYFFHRHYFSKIYSQIRLNKLFVCVVVYNERTESLKKYINMK